MFGPSPACVLIAARPPECAEQEKPVEPKAFGNTSWERFADIGDDALRELAGDNLDDDEG